MPWRKFWFPAVGYWVKWRDLWFIWFFGRLPRSVHSAQGRYSSPPRQRGKARSSAQFSAPSATLPSHISRLSRTTNKHDLTAIGPCDAQHCLLCRKGFFLVSNSSLRGNRNWRSNLKLLDCHVACGLLAMTTNSGFPLSREWQSVFLSLFLLNRSSGFFDGFFGDFGNQAMLDWKFFT